MEREDITAAAFAPGGWLLTGTASGRLLQWDTASARCVRAVDAHPPVRAQSKGGLSPNSRALRNAAVSPAAAAGRRSVAQAPATWQWEDRRERGLEARGGVGAGLGAPSASLTAARLVRLSPARQRCFTATSIAQGVRVLALAGHGLEVVSGGGDGRLVAWELTREGVGRAVASMKVGAAPLRAPRACGSGECNRG
jgi:hypothetical protein